MKQKYKITENLSDHPTYTGQELTIDLNLGNDYYELVDIDGNRFMAGEEELTKIAIPSTPVNDKQEQIGENLNDYPAKIEAFEIETGINKDGDFPICIEVAYRYNQYPNLYRDNKELFQMVRDLKDCVKRLSQDGLSQHERDTEAQWEGEAHELLSRVNPNYYKNANE